LNVGSNSRRPIYEVRYVNRFFPIEGRIVQCE